MEMLRVGKVSSVDKRKLFVKVTYPDKDNIVSTELPVLNAGIFILPKVDDFVLVAYLPNSKGGGVCLGRISDIKDLIAGEEEKLVIDGKDKEIVIKNFRGQISLEQILNFEQRISNLERRS